MGISNLKWREAMAEVKAINEANTFFSRDECLAGWPETLKPDQLAVLQRPYSKSDTLQAGKTAAFREWIESACLAGLVPHIKGKEIKHRERKIPTGTHLHEAARRLNEVTSYEVDICNIKASDFAVLLASEGEEPSVHLAAWIDATAPKTPAPLVADESAASGKKWTPERLAEVKAYRDKHGTSQAAKHYGITTTRIRALLPGEKPRPQGYSAFTHQPK